MFGRTGFGDSVPRANATCNSDLYRAADQFDAWGEQETLTGLNLQSTSFPDVPSHSTMQPGLANHMCKRKEN
jgi:hypothetical protein